MTDSRNNSAASAPPSMKIFELLVLAVVSGLALGAAYATFDFLHHAPDMAPLDVLITAALAAGPAIVGTVSVVVVVFVVLAVRRARLSRCDWTAFLAGGHVVALAAALVLIGTTHHRNWLGLCVIAAAIPPAVLVMALLGNARVLDAGGRSIVMALAGVQAFVIAACGHAALKAWGLPVFLSVAPVAAAAALLVVAARRVPQAPIRVGLIIALGLPLSVALFATVGAPDTPASAAKVKRSDPRPNVVLIVLDTLRRDRLGCYGHPGGLTPELDRIAATGVVYEQAISAAPWTVPSHASMFTGLFPVSHGCSYAHHLWLDDAFLTLAESLKELGFQTVALNSNVGMVQNNLFQGFDQRVWLDGPYDATSVFRLARILGIPEHWADKGGREADQELGAWLNETHDDAPFFLYVNLYEVHGPYLPPLAQRRAYLPPDTGLLAATRVGMYTKPTELHFAGTTDDRTQSIVTGLYEAAVRYQDARLGELIARLRAATDFDNTLLIIAADHGENLGEEGRWEHLFAINDALIHVPMIIRYPSRFPGGTRVGGLCQTTDIPATVFDILGVDCPLPGASTRSLAPDRFVPAEHAYAQVAPYYGLLGTADRTLGFQASDSRFRADLRVIRTETMKYVWSSDGNHRLYDLTQDPLETDNQVARLSDVAQTLDAQLAAWWEAQPTYVREEQADPSANPLDEKTLQRLRSLGYVGD